jgi:hypothetical protein
MKVEQFELLNYVSISSTLSVRNLNQYFSWHTRLPKAAAVELRYLPAYPISYPNDIYSVKDKADIFRSRAYPDPSVNGATYICDYCQWLMKL